MQRIADEVNGVKRRAVNATEDDKEDKRVAKRRKMAEDEVRNAVDDYNVRSPSSKSSLHGCIDSSIQKRTRNKTLLDMHSAKTKASAVEDDGPPVIWDHTRDMSVGGRLLDDKERGKLITDAKGLEDRFGRGKSSFL